MTDTVNANKNNGNANIQKEKWVEPEVSVMDVTAATENSPGVGADGGSFDCSFS